MTTAEGVAAQPWAAPKPQPSKPHNARPLRHGALAPSPLNPTHEPRTANPTLSSDRAFNRLPSGDFSTVLNGTTTNGNPEARFESLDGVSYQSHAIPYLPFDASPNYLTYRPSVCREQLTNNCMSSTRPHGCGCPPILRINRRLYIMDPVQSAYSA